MISIFFICKLKKRILNYLTPSRPARHNTQQGSTGARRHLVFREGMSLLLSLSLPALSLSTPLTHTLLVAQVFLYQDGQPKKQFQPIKIDYFNILVHVLFFSNHYSRGLESTLTFYGLL